MVEWLLGVVNHLPSEDQCQKCLVAPVDDKEKHDDMMLGRTKCYDLVTKVGTNQKQGGKERNLIIQLSFQSLLFGSQQGYNNGHDDHPMNDSTANDILTVLVSFFFPLWFFVRQRKQKNRRSNETQKSF